MSASRFSRRVVADEISRALAALYRDHDFDERDGYAQVRGRGEEINRAYGEWDALLRLSERLGVYDLVSIAERAEAQS